MSTLREQLKETEDEIAAVKAGGQMIQTRIGKVQLASLSTLLAERDSLLQRIADEEASVGDGGCFGSPVAYFGRR